MTAFREFVNQLTAIPGVKKVRPIQVQGSGDIFFVRTSPWSTPCNRMTARYWSRFRCNGRNFWPTMLPAPISWVSSSPISAAATRMCYGRLTRRARQAAAASINRARRRGVVDGDPRSPGRFRAVRRTVPGVVTLVAHWRSAMFRANEILDPDAVGRFLSIPVARWRTRKGCRCRDGRRIESPSAGDRRTW